MRGTLSKEFEQYPVVALVGRTNVGKSTLFNKLIGEQKAVVAAVAGTTRDSNFGICVWRGRQFVVVDTGGYQPHAKNDIEEKTVLQMKRVVKDANLIFFIIDSQNGVTVDDRQFLRDLRKSTKKQIIAVGNKIDKASHAHVLYDKMFLQLGLGAPTPVSAASGLGIGDLLDIALESLPAEQEKETIEEREPIRIAIIGRTNVGKSSLLNSILGEERVIVSAIEHTTREPQDMHLEYKGVPMVIIDTVGMRRKGKIRSAMDREGFLRSIKCIKKADIVMLILDATVTTSKQERHLLQIAIDSGAGIIMVVNKWDRVEDKDTKTIGIYEHYFREQFSFVSWAPIMFVSALSGKRTHKIVDTILDVDRERNKELAQTDITGFLKQMIKRQPPQILRNKKKPIIYGFRQTGTKPPRFSLSVNESESVSYAYLRFLENRLREIYGFAGTPLSIYTEQRKKQYNVPH